MSWRSLPVKQGYKNAARTRTVGDICAFITGGFDRRGSIVAGDGRNIHSFCRYPPPTRRQRKHGVWRVGLYPYSAHLARLCHRRKPESCRSHSARHLPQSARRTVYTGYFRRGFTGRYVCHCVRPAPAQRPVPPAGGIHRRLCNHLPGLYAQLGKRRIERQPDAPYRRNDQLYFFLADDVPDVRDFGRKHPRHRLLDHGLAQRIEQHDDHVDGCAFGVLPARVVSVRNAPQCPPVRRRKSPPFRVQRQRCHPYPVHHHLAPDRCLHIGGGHHRFRGTGHSSHRPPLGGNRLPDIINRILP